MRPGSRRWCGPSAVLGPSENVYFSGHDSDLGEHRPETPVRKLSGPTARDVAGNRRGQQLIPGRSGPRLSVAFQRRAGLPLRVVLGGISPMVWRRLEVPAESSIAVCTRPADIVRLERRAPGPVHHPRGGIPRVAARLGRRQPLRPGGAAGRVRLRPTSGSPTSTLLLRGGTTSGGGDPAPLAAPPLPSLQRRGPPGAAGGMRQPRPSSWPCASAGRWQIAVRMAELLAGLWKPTATLPPTRRSATSAMNWPGCCTWPARHVRPAAVNSASERPGHHTLSRQRREAAVKITVQVAIDARMARRRPPRGPRDRARRPHHGHRGPGPGRTHELPPRVQDVLVTAQVATAAAAG